MSYLDWKVGDKVAYVGGSVIGKRRYGWRRLFGSWDSLPTLLIVGSVYEVKRIECGRSISSGKVEVGIEITPDPHASLGGLYPAVRFRKVQEHKTSIEVFTALLNPSEDETFRELEAEMLDYEPTEVPFR